MLLSVFTWFRWPTLAPQQLCSLFLCTFGSLCSGRSFSSGCGFLGRLAINMGDPNYINIRKKGGARDNTQYTCWTAPSFAAHHGMCISAECVYADALLLSQGAMRMKAARARA